MRYQRYGFDNFDAAVRLSVPGWYEFTLKRAIEQNLWTSKQTKKMLKLKMR